MPQFEALKEVHVIKNNVLRLETPLDALEFAFFERFIGPRSRFVKHGADRAAFDKHFQLKSFIKPYIASEKIS